MNEIQGACNAREMSREEILRELRQPQMSAMLLNPEQVKSLGVDIGTASFQSGEDSRLTFAKLLYRMQEIHDKKGVDYETGQLYSNHREVEKLGIPAWKYPIARMFEKFSRIQNYCQRGTLAVKDEGFEDSMIDIANLALISLILHHEETNAKTDTVAVPPVQKSASGTLRSYLADVEGKPLQQSNNRD